MVGSARSTLLSGGQPLSKVPRPSSAWAGPFHHRPTLSRVMRSLKQPVARTLALRAAEPFWQARYQPRYYDFNVWSEHKFVEKLRYIHRNPVMRGLVDCPEDWDWSSFRHYAKDEAGRVEIESQRTARRREQAGIFLIVRKHPAA